MVEPAFPYTCSTVASRLPRRPTVGQIVCDGSGNIWQYDVITNSWVNKGTLDAPPTVTESQDGLVTTDVFDRIDLLKTATNSGNSLPEELKIKPHTDVYWYLFHSSDKLIKFIPEDQNILRIEVDRGRLYSYIVSSRCRGPKGETGEKGDPGIDGASNGAETCVEQVTISDDGNEIVFEASVQTPLTTDISLRLAASPTDDPVIIILVPAIAGAPIIDYVDSSISLNTVATISSIRFDNKTGVLSGSFVSLNGFGGSTCVLAKQKGPDGVKGDDGSCILKPNECSVSYTDIQFTSPIVAIRKGCNDNQLLTMSANLFSTTCVSKLRFDAASPDYANLFSGGIVNGTTVTGRMLAARKTLDPCKELSGFKFAPIVAARPALELPEWQPQSDCNVEKRAQLSDLNWIPATGAETNQTWDSPDGAIVPKYPWQIMMQDAESAGSCDPCDEEASGDGPPCPDNSGTTTTAAPSPQYQLRSLSSGSCSCVTVDSVLGAGDIALNTYDSLAECQTGLENICGDTGTSYQLRKDVSNNQCACLNSNDPIPANQVIIGSFSSLLACEMQRNLNGDCAAASGLALWFSAANVSCYCQGVSLDPAAPQDILLGAYVPQELCSSFCMESGSIGEVVKICTSTIPATNWHTFVIGQIKYRSGLVKNVGLYYNGSVWSITDSDYTVYTLSLSNCSMAQLTVIPPAGSQFVLTAPIVIAGVQGIITFDNTVNPSFQLDNFKLFGTT